MTTRKEILFEGRPVVTARNVDQRAKLLIADITGDVHEQLSVHRKMLWALAIIINKDSNPAIISKVNDIMVSAEKKHNQIEDVLLAAEQFKTEHRL